MRHYAILRILLALFFLYIAWPLIPTAMTRLEMTFWGLWLGFFLLVMGANLATLLHLSDPPVMEQQELNRRKSHNH